MQTFNYLPFIRITSQRYSHENYLTIFIYIHFVQLLRQCNYCYIHFFTGSFGVHVPLKTKERQNVEFYTKMGFMELSQGINSNDDFTYLGRVF